MRLIPTNEIRLAENAKTEDDWFSSVFRYVNERIQKTTKRIDMMMYLCIGDSKVLEYEPLYPIVDRKWDLILPYFRRYLVIRAKYERVRGYIFVWTARGKDDEALLHFSSNIETLNGVEREECVAEISEVGDLRFVGQPMTIRFGDGKLFYNLFQPIKPQAKLQEEVYSYTSW